MAPSLLSISISKFKDEVSRKTPFPGGGSVVALAGALGATLALTVIDLTLDEAGGDAQDERLVAMAKQLIKSISRCRRWTHSISAISFFSPPDNRQ